MKKTFTTCDISQSLLYGNFHSAEKDLPEIRHELEGAGSTLSVPVIGFWMDQDEKVIRDMKLLQLYTRRDAQGRSSYQIWINLEEPRSRKRYKTEAPTHWSYLTKGSSYMSVMKFDPLLHPTESELTDLAEEMAKSLF